MAKTPKYLSVIGWIHDQIEAGILREGDKLETEEQLTARFKVSRQTVRKALGELEKDGTINRVQGSGSYIRNGTSFAAPPSGVVTILSSSTDSDLFREIQQSMARVLKEEDYTTRILFTNNHRQREKEILTNLLHRGSRDPVIAEPVTSALPNRNAPLYRELQKRGVPIIFYNSWYPELDIPHVSPDDRAGGRMVTEYLISLGHRRIGCLMKNDDGQGILRYSGYQDALEEAGIALDESIVCWIDSTSLKHSLNPVDGILDRLQDCTGIVCYNDEAAYLLTQLCQSRQIPIPDQISLVSFDDSRLTGLNQVPLTSVAHPMGALGEKTARNLLALIRNPAFRATYEFPPRLSIRESAARPKVER